MKFFFLSMALLCQCLFLQAAGPGDQGLYLDKYSFKEASTTVPVAKLIYSGKPVFKLKGEHASLFVIKNNQLFLSPKGKAFYAKATRAAISIEAIEGKKTVSVSSFIILKDEFIQNRVVAHRGAWKNTKVPQNSIASLQKAVELGCGGSEFDIHMTLDSVLVINHDATFEGLTIEKTNYKDLLKHSLKNGEPIPTFESYIKAGMLQQKTQLIAELKPSVISKERGQRLAERVMKEVRALQAQAWVVYISFDYDILKRLLELESTAKAMYLNGNIAPSQLKADNMLGADYHFSVYLKDENWIQNAHKAGIEVNAWTVNDTLVMDYLLVRNVDYLTTDEPEKAIIRTPRYITNNKWKLVWSDEFNYKGLPDATKWDYDMGGNGWGNNELQFYTKADTNNAIVTGSSLKIINRKQSREGKEYTSARMVTKNKGDWKYGRVEVRAKLPKGRGLWPAIWMLPTDWKYGGWPASGEIDIMEHVGYNPDSLYGTVHTKSFNHSIHTQVGKNIRLPEPYTTFHVYAIEWYADRIDFIFDGATYLTFKNSGKGSAEWPFDQNFHLILNIATGGNWGGQKGIDESIFPGTMEVDYVRVFQEK